MSVRRLLLSFIILFAINLIGINQVSAAGPPGPPDGGDDPPCWPPPCIPIDGGISFLVIAGLAYGGKKAYETIKGKTP